MKEGNQNSQSSVEAKTICRFNEIQRVASKSWKKALGGWDADERAGSHKTTAHVDNRFRQLLQDGNRLLVRKHLGRKVRKKNEINPQ